MIEFDHVTRTYGERPAVTDLSLSIPRGELFALLGPNGAGKTTTIKMLVGLLRPSRGTVRVCGYDLVREARSAHLHTGYVPDEPTLYDKLTGREFLWFIADMFGMARHEAGQRIDREMNNFEINRFADDLVESYSLGMKQRLVFAAALLHDPDVLVLDEPMVGLDPRSVRIVKDLLRTRTQEGMIVFMSTHTLAMAEEMADRVGIMVKGELRFLGTVAELRDQVALESTSLESLYLELTADAADGTGHAALPRGGTLDGTRGA